jgi:hypothetical protein
MCSDILNSSVAAHVTAPHKMRPSQSDGRSQDWPVCVSGCSDGAVSVDNDLYLIHFIIGLYNSQPRDASYFFVSFS